MLPTTCPGCPRSSGRCCETSSSECPARGCRLATHPLLPTLHRALHPCCLLACSLKHSCSPRRRRGRLTGIGAGIGLAFGFCIGHLLRLLRWRGVAAYVESMVVLAAAFLVFYVTQVGAGGGGGGGAWSCPICITTLVWCYST